MSTPSVFANSSLSSSVLSNVCATPLVFVLGKGGVGKTTASCAMAKHLANQGKRCLIVQWALADRVASFFSRTSQGWKSSEAFSDYSQETLLESGVSTINFNFAETMKEYFVDHLGQKLIYSLVIENKHVQKLLQAAPGVQELFFLGRLFWLIELALKERGWKYDHVFVDTPATGHGVSLFGAARSIAKFGLAGPLGEECRRVQELLDNPKKTSYVAVTLPEELPLQKTRELIKKIETEVKYPCAGIFLNRHISNEFCAQFEFETIGEKSAPVLRMVEKSFLSAHSLAKNFVAERPESVVFVPDASISQYSVLNTWLNVLENSSAAQGEPRFVKENERKL